ncbi:MAG TPA: ATP-binding protein [Candidatus Sulfotelmatobacter sp.]|nr:ATP-binding protein [Candidatus Sulfotelmatobacter sp.]
MSVQKQDHPSTKVLVAGISGTGKTTLLEKLLKRERARWTFIYDHKNGDFARRYGVRPCFTVDELERAVARGGLVIYNPSRDFAGEKERGFDFFASWYWEIGQEIRGKKNFVADELQSLVDVYSKPDGLLKILDEGRTYQMDCFFAAAAVNGINNQVRKQITEIFAFRQGDEAGAKWFEEKGFEVQKILSLKNGEWIYKNVITGETNTGGKAFEPKNSRRNLAGL